MSEPARAAAAAGVAVRRLGRSALGWAPLALAVTACGGGAGAPPPLEFVDVAGSAGLVYDGPTYCATAGDYDADGWTDLAISNHGRVRLYRNRGDGTFADDSAAGEFLRGDTHGLSWVDLDGDGRLDLYVTIGAARGRGRGSNRFHRNLGGGRFARVEELPEALEDPLGRGRCSAPADLDGDGRLDLMVLNYPQKGRENRLALSPASGVRDAGIEAGLAAVRAACVTVTRFGADRRPLLVAYGGGPDTGRLYRWSEGRLEDVTEALGVRPAGLAVSAVAAGDYDADGDLDLYYVNGDSTPDGCEQRADGIEFRFGPWPAAPIKGFRFRADGPFDLDLVVGGHRRPGLVRLGRDGAPAASLPLRVDPAADELAGDPRLGGDGEPGIYLWREAEELTLAAILDPVRAPAVSGRVAGDGGVELVATIHQQFTPRARPNVLWQNRGDRFVDVTAEAGVGDPRAGRDAAFADLDNDGDLDLFVVNGGGAFDNLPDVLYRNRGDGTFADVTAEAGARGPDRGRGACAVAFDYDRDGDLDLLTTNGEGPPFGNDGPYTLLQNRSPAGHWAEVDLRGSGANAFALGARVSARFGGRTLTFHRTGTTGRFSTSVLPIHLGLGDSRAADIEVEWPSGALQRSEVRAGQRLLLVEADAQAPADAAP